MTDNVKKTMSEILIIGGGVIGLSLARTLRKSGAGKITILERGRAGAEASFAAAGMLAPQAETDKTDDFFRFCTESNRLYPSFAEELLDETGVDIELDRAGTLYLAFTDADGEEIRRRYEWQRGVGLPVELLTAEEIRKNEPFVSPDVREGLFFPNDHQVENRQLLAALQKFAEFNEIEIRENAEVVNLLIFRRRGGSGNRRVDFARQTRRRGFADAENRARARADDRVSNRETIFQSCHIQPARLHRAAPRRSNSGRRDGRKCRF
jgi:glycine/D-amino acid oxidase-like deaminating enzyme